MILMKNPIIQERRLGRVLVARTTFEEMDLGAFFAQFHPVRCEYHYTSDEFEYTGYSAHFRPVAQGLLPPTYGAILETTIHEEPRAETKVSFY